MAGMICSVDDCEKPGVRRGWCVAHYARWRKYGNTETVRKQWSGYVVPLCQVEGCEIESHGYGYCPSHYKRWKRHGDPLGGRRSVALGSDEERFFTFIQEAPNGCWIWEGASFGHGYGEFKVGGRDVQAHRWSYEHFNGPIPQGFTVDHQCHNRDIECPGGPSCLHRLCVNPDHLDAASIQVNLQRAVARRQNRRQANA